VEPYISERLADRPVILSTIAEGYCLRDHLPPALEPVRVLLDSADEKLFWIIDMPHLQASVDEIVWATNYAIRNQPESLLKHANLRGVAIVNTDPLYERLVEGLNTPVYGYITGICIVATLAEALAYVDGQMANG
jgi:hypothetical protein